MSIIRKTDAETPEQIAAREEEIAAFRNSTRNPFDKRMLARVEMTPAQRAWVCEKTADLNVRADALLAMKALQEAEGEHVDLHAAREESKHLRNELEAARRQLREAQLVIEATGREADRAKVLASGAQAISSGVD